MTKKIDSLIFFYTIMPKMENLIKKFDPDFFKRIILCGILMFPTILNETPFLITEEFSNKIYDLVWITEKSVIEVLDEEEFFITELDGVRVVNNDDFNSK